MILRFIRLAVSAVLMMAMSGALHAQPMVGVNKFDLFSQYMGTASGCNDGAACRRVTMAMAKKSLDDAKDAGAGFVRVSMTGPTIDDTDKRNSLVLWLSHPDQFWHRVDEMMDDLDRRGIRIVPVLMWGGKKFPVMAGEPTGELLRNPESKSWQWLSAYVTEFITRYRSRPTVLFYELTNEFNNAADLDHDKRCARPKHKRLCEYVENFTTDEMIAFTRRFASLIRSLDSTRQISSGFSIPRGSAEHLRAQPEWSPNGPDWKMDTREEFAKNLKDIHEAVDIISIHLYGGERNQRFGSRDVTELLAEAKRIANSAGKPLFVGEFGDADPVNAGSGSHTARMIDKIVEWGIPYSAVWVWEFYQQNTYQTHSTKPSRLSLEPGYTDYLISRIRQANGVGDERRVADTLPPRVVLTWPLECMSLKKMVDLHAVASDDSGAVQRVEFLLDGKLLAADSSPPYSASFSPIAVRAGLGRLTARAYDLAGNTAEFSSRVVLGEKSGGAGCTAGQE